MAIALLVGRDMADKERHQWFIEAWIRALHSLDASLDIRVWPDVGLKSEIDVALVWRHPLNALTELPNLTAIISLAAGVDHVFVDRHLSPHIQIARVVDHYMSTDIMQYVVAAVLRYVKRFDHWQQKQIQQEWNKEPPFTLVNEPVGVMGLGFLGSKAAIALSDVGLTVKAWRQTKTEFHDKRIACFYGDGARDEFLKHLRVLVCMLPLTPKTNGMLSKSLFSHLPKGAYIVNVGRGEHLIEDDLLDALHSGQIAGATLDVFQEEPLPRKHPFWLHPNVIVTPHIASVTNPMTAAPQVLENYRRALAGQDLTNRVSLINFY